MGLAISKQLVELFEGTIKVNSEEGKGSTFIFTGKFSRQPSRSVSAKTRATREQIRQVRGIGCTLSSAPVALSIDLIAKGFFHFVERIMLCGDR